MLARLANPAHASWVVLLLVASTVAETIPRHGPAVWAGVTTLGLFGCLVLALARGVGVVVGVGPLVSFFIIDLSTLTLTGAIHGASCVGSFIIQF